MHLANLYYADRRYVEAIEILQSCKTDSRCAFHYHWCRLLALWAEGNESQACKEIDSFMEIQSIPPDKSQFILDIARQTGDFKRMRRFLKKCGDPESLRSLFLIVPMVSIFRFLPKRWLNQKVYKLENQLTKRGRFGLLRCLIESLRYVDSSNPEWLVKLGQWIRHTRDVYNPQFDRELNWYLTAMRMMPHYPPAIAGYLRTLYDKQQWTDCLEWVGKTPERFLPNWVSSLQAACLSNLGRVEEAKSRWEQLVAKEGNLHARFCLGLLALEKGDSEAGKILLFANEDRNLQLIRYFFSEVAHQPNPASCDGQVVLDFMVMNQTEGNCLQPDIVTLSEDSQNISVNTGSLEDSLMLPEVKQQTNPEIAVVSPCFICGSIEPRTPLWKDRTTGWLRSRCPGCSMISVSPLPSLHAIQTLYIGEGRLRHSLRKRYMEEVNEVLQMSEAASRRLPLMQDIMMWDRFDWMAFEASLVNKKRSLDIGCSAGKAVKVLLNCGWQAEGIDLDADAVRYGQERGLPVRVGSVEEQNNYAVLYDLITLIDVIEHLADPADCLKRSFNALSPGGVMFIKTPCADSLPHWFIGDAWLESSEHLHFFSRRTLIRLLEKTGYQIIGFKQTQEAPTSYLHDEIWQSRFYPRLLNDWINRLKVGDTLMILARRPC